MSQMNALPDDAIWLATYDTFDGDYGRDNESPYYRPSSKTMRSFGVCSITSRLAI